MVVDFELRRSAAVRVASISRRGPWKEGNLRREFGELTEWARRHRIQTGRWIFSHRSDNHWEACLEIKGTAKATGRIRLKTLPTTLVARCIFDPDQVADRVVYHGLSDFVRQRRRDKAIKAVAGSREVYTGDPWTNARAWANCEVQFLVRK